MRNPTVLEYELRKVCLIKCGPPILNVKFFFHLNSETVRNTVDKNYANSKIQGINHYFLNPLTIESHNF